MVEKSEKMEWNGIVRMSGANHFKPFQQNKMECNVWGYQTRVPFVLQKDNTIKIMK